ncbi:DUF1080 domain-containing protein [Gemmata sp. G18]|uniref:DUF1080 domain-containing protein n=1 Tax=Gemmata palustris TaxID=2822762 RepID=A0ABS5C3L0_9BACT|nr:DUF1080 domain-containing protein [Gemmata palustris]MBP3959743.1 DUF1080 domain-containing protein [Gemmata palustris]
MRIALQFGALAVVVCAAGLRADEKPKATEKPIEPPAGFTNLFNGTSLDGWKVSGGKAEAWGTESGVIVCKSGGGGYLLTEKEYANFEFRCEYKWAKAGGNSGVGIRTPEKGDPAYAGMEIQLIDDEGWESVNKSKLAGYQHTGSIYDVQPAKEAKNKAIGEWNTVKVVCDGRKVTVVHNDVELVNANLDDYKKKFDKHPGLERTKGHIGFQSYNIRVDFRNVWIKELK